MRLCTLIYKLGYNDLDLTVSVQPKKVLEWKYFILPSIFSLWTAKWQLGLNVQIMCGVKFNLKKYYLQDMLRNESIISMLSNAKMLN